jgi:hypothetical protein
MRYRIGEAPELSTYGTTGDFLTATVALSIVIGAVLVWIGWRGRQWWLVIWNVGLVLAALAWFAWTFWLGR